MLNVRNSLGLGAASFDIWIPYIQNGMRTWYEHMQMYWMGTNGWVCVRVVFLCTGIVYPFGIMASLIADFGSVSMRF